MIAGPSNMAIFGALATAALPDLHLMDPGQPTRALPRATFEASEVGFASRFWRTRLP